VKLLILSFYYEPDLCAGSFRCTALVKQLLACNYPHLEIEVLTTLPQRYATYQIDALRDESSAGLRIRRFKIPKHASGMWDQVKAFGYYAKQVRDWIQGRSYDVVLATSSRLMTASLGAFVARSKNIPLYLDVRDLFLDTLNDLLPTHLKRLLAPGISCLEKWTFRRAQVVNVVSGGFVDYFQQRYPKIKLRTFTNGIDPEFLNACSLERSEQGLMTIVYAGNIGEGQGLHRIIPALAKQLANKAQFIIVGDGGRKVALEKAVTEAQCSNVQIIAPMNRQALIALYQTADILFLHLNDMPAFKRVLPSKIFEYAAMGKPIWAGVAGYAAEFLQNELTNIAVFPPCDANQAIKVLTKIKLASVERGEFIRRYDRASIMRNMAEDIMCLFLGNDYKEV
jgi:glycosyltransferase involved in cell wall biosynthesis